MRFWDSYRNPWNQMDVLRKEVINQLFGDMRSQSRNVEFPPVNIWGNEEQLVVTAEVPGIAPESLKVNALEDNLFIEGKREAAGLNLTYHRQERQLGNFKRVFQLPYKVDPEKVEARYDKGVLEIVLPRSDKEKPKQINVAIS